MNDEQTTIVTGPARILLGQNEELIPLQRRMDHLQITDWVQSLAPWQVFATLTFVWEASMHSAMRCYEGFMDRRLAHVPYFYALEGNPSRGGFHVHAIWSGTETVYRKAVWGKWFRRYGRARIEPIRGTNNVATYCAKYLCKEAFECGWWNFKVRGLKGLPGL